ncbi:cytidine deaminase [Candidatus Parvarchaeota archaeon]|nr:cytidine deaminase [Candidatus Parvarchaeota archaeon]
MPNENLEEIVSDERLKEGLKAAINARERAKTFRSKVGVAFEMYDGRIIPGFNIETYGHKGNHAEEVGLIVAMSEGYNGTDFKRMIEIFQDAGHDDVEVFPACPLDCWGRLLEFTHPYLEIVVADVRGKVHYRTTLKEMTSGIKPPAQVYPSNKIRLAKPKSNITPKLPLDKSLRPAYDSDLWFRQYCDEILKVRLD